MRGFREAGLNYGQIARRLDRSWAVVAYHLSEPWKAKAKGAAA